VTAEVGLCANPTGVPISTDAPGPGC
jgi:hypothetical protein